MTAEFTLLTWSCEEPEEGRGKEGEDEFVRTRLSPGRQQPKEAIEGFIGVIEGQGELPCLLDPDNSPLGLAVRPAAYDESKSYALVDVHSVYIALDLETRAGRRGIQQFYEKRLRAFRDAGPDR